MDDIQVPLLVSTFTRTTLHADHRGEEGFAILVHGLFGSATVKVEFLLRVSEVAAFSQPTVAQTHEVPAVGSLELVNIDSLCFLCFLFQVSCCFMGLLWVLHLWKGVFVVAALVVWLFGGPGVDLLWADRLHGTLLETYFCYSKLNKLN